MTMFFLYPSGRQKAMTFSFDDGFSADLRLLEILNRYHMKCTWNLNSRFLQNQDYVKTDEIGKHYQGHEIACHGATHGLFTYLPMEDIISEIREDRRTFEKLLGHPVTGLAYPNGYIANWLAEALKVLGIEYSRTIRSTKNFLLPEDFLFWDPTCHYKEASQLADSFLHQPQWARLPLFYIWGHSYELRDNDHWDMFEDFCRKMSADQNIWHATNGEICRYIKAIRSLICGVDMRYIHNPSATSVWFTGQEGHPVELHAGETLQLAD